MSGARRSPIGGSRALERRGRDAYDMSYNLVAIPANTRVGSQRETLSNTERLGCFAARVGAIVRG